MIPLTKIQMRNSTTTTTTTKEDCELAACKPLLQGAIPGITCMATIGALASLRLLVKMDGAILSQGFFVSKHFVRGEAKMRLLKIKGFKIK